MFAEVISGEFGHNDLVTSRRNPQYTVERDPLTGLFKPAHIDPALKNDNELPAALWKTILAIPHTIEGDHAPEFALRGLHFEPGYYEFYLDRRTEAAALEPFFIDYSNQQPFMV